jgi:hypothetical protein
MKLVRVLLALVWVSSGIVFGQHVELGVFGNYSTQDIPGAAEHLFGLGGRADFKIVPILQAEFETAYDFKYSHFNLSQQGAVVVLNNTELGYTSCERRT